MSEQIIEQSETLSFFAKYKKRILMTLSISLVPAIIFMCSIIGISIYLFANNESNWHPYRSYIEKGYSAGLTDGNKDKNIIQNDFDYLERTPWYTYKQNTKWLKEQAIIEKEKHLEQFPEHSRGAERAEMRANNIKLPSESQFNRRFTNGVDFYVHHIKQIVKREAYDTEEAYLEALRDVAWKVGYEYGYAKGLLFSKGLVPKLT